MAGAIEDLTVNYEENGRPLVRETDKVILTRGAWATVLFRYQEWSEADQGYRPEKYVIRRYRKMNNEYRVQSKFVISSRDQARRIVDALSGWLAGDEKAAVQEGAADHS